MRRKAKAASALGGMCQCCGEIHLEFMQFHHRNLNGNRDRKTIGTSLSRLMTEVIGGRRDVDLVCANCHFAITQLGRCPHEDET
jgi:hypothetical protein